MVGICRSFFVRPSRPFSLLLLVAKVAQKPRTAFLAGARGVKPKTNATRAKHLPSLFFHAFTPLARHDCTRQSLIRRQCKVRVCGAPSAQSLFVLIWLLNVRWLVSAVHFLCDRVAHFLCYWWCRKNSTANKRWRICSNRM